MMNAASTLLVAVKFVIKYFFYYRVNRKQLSVLAYKKPSAKVSVLIATHGVMPLSTRCIANAVRTAGYRNAEFIIYNNNAGPEMERFLSKMKRKDKRIRVITSRKNTGLNAYHLGFKEARGEFFVAMDHDVVAFCENWLLMLLEDYIRVPRVKFLAADVIGDDYTDGAKYPAWTYQHVRKDGVALSFGAVGGWLAMTDRAVYEAVGGFPYFPGQIYFLHDKYYIRKLLLKGYRIAIDERVKVYHARGLSARIGNETFADRFFTYADKLSF